MIWTIILCCNLSWMAVCGLRISSIDNPITPLRLYFLIKLTPKSAGGVELFNGIDYVRSKQEFNHLLSMRTIYFQGFFNMSCQSMSFRRFLDMKGQLDEDHQLSFACLNNFPVFNGFGAAILKITPHIIIDHVPSSSAYLESVMKPLLKQTLYSTRTRSSIPLCKTLQMGSYLDYFMVDENCWRMADAYCLITAPELVPSLLPDMYEINFRQDILVDSLDKLIHTIAVVLTISRLEQRHEIRKRIFSSIVRTKLKKQHLFSKFVTVQSELAILHNLLSSYLGTVIQTSLIGMERNMQTEANTVHGPLLKVWDVATRNRPKRMVEDLWGLRYNIFMILAEVLPDHKLGSLSKKLKELLNHNIAQERVICSIYDILEARDTENSMLLIKLINDHLVKRRVQRPFKCRKPTGYGKKVPLKQDRMILLRRHSFVYTSVFLLKTSEGRKYISPESLNIDWMRRRVARKLTKLVEDDCFAVMDSSGHGPFLFLNLAAHPYKTLLFWDLLTLSSSLRLKMPFEIHPTLSLAYLNGSEKAMSTLFDLLVAIEYHGGKPNDMERDRIHKLEAYSCYKNNGWRYNGATKKSYRYYENHLMSLSLQVRPPSHIRPLRVILDNYNYYWRQNFVFCEFEDIAPVMENHLDLAGYFINPDLSRCK